MFQTQKPKFKPGDLLVYDLFRDKEYFVFLEAVLYKGYYLVCLFPANKKAREGWGPYEFQLNAGCGMAQDLKIATNDS